MHFMNPVPLMVLVEVIRALQTSGRYLSNHHATVGKIGQKPVAVNDAPRLRLQSRADAPY